VRPGRPDGIQATLGIGAIAYDVTQTQPGIGTLLRLLQGKQRLPISVKITKDYDACHLVFASETRFLQKNLVGRAWFILPRELVDNLACFARQIRKT